LTHSHVSFWPFQTLTNNVSIIDLPLSNVNELHKTERKKKDTFSNLYFTLTYLKSAPLP
jgi:hypothetical protein